MCSEPSRPDRQHQVTGFGAGVPDLDHHVTRQLRPQFAQHGAAFPDQARTELKALVPLRRQAQDRPVGARAQAADNHVLDPGRVLQRDDVLALRAGVAELGARGGAVLEQQCTKLRVDPGLGDHAGAILRAPFVRHQLRHVFDVALGDQVLLLEHLQ